MMLPEQVVIKTGKRKYCLNRISDILYDSVRQNCLSVEEDYALLLNFANRETLIYSSFSRMYVALKSRFGAPGRFFDDWKGSFSFPFLLTFQDNDTTYDYFINFTNIRSSMEFGLMKLVHVNDRRYDRMLLYSPFDDFPGEEIRYFKEFFVGYLTGYFSVIEKIFDEQFYHVVESNLIVFGFQEGSFFDNQYDNWEEFSAAIESLKNSISG